MNSQIAIGISVASIIINLIVLIYFRRDILKKSRNHVAPDIRENGLDFTISDRCNRAFSAGSRAWYVEMENKQLREQIAKYRRRNSQHRARKRNKPNADESVLQNAKTALIKAKIDLLEQDRKAKSGPMIRPVN